MRLAIRSRRSIIALNTEGVHVKAARYREKAAELREIARATQDPLAHKELSFLTEQYERLAKRVEAEKKKRPRP